MMMPVLCFADTTSNRLENRKYDIVGKFARECVVQRFDEYYNMYILACKTSTFSDIKYVIISNEEYALFLKYKIK